jgi:ribosomal protein S18 acetylase RimI-like enzyme
LIDARIRVMGLEIRRGDTGDIERLEPLWRAMWEHHASLPEMPGVRPPEDSWSHRRREYEEWLGGGDAARYALLLAERDGSLVGYALVSLGGGAATWGALGEKTAEIESLSVLDSERNSGVGGSLVEAAVAFAREHGAGSVLVAAAHSNEGALRFYEREGFSDFYVLLARPVDAG